jgi:hypothetical protein
VQVALRNGSAIVMLSETRLSSEVEVENFMRVWMYVTAAVHM